MSYRLSQEELSRCNNYWKIIKNLACIRFPAEIIINVDAEKQVMYSNVPKFLDRQVWANIVDPDRAAARGESDQGLHCLPFHLHLLDAVLVVVKWYSFNFRIITAFFQVFKFLGLLR